MDVRRDVLLIFKEAVNNAARHSGCSRAEIDLRVAGSRLVLTLGDNGVGFDTSLQSDGDGLSSMQRRAGRLRRPPPDCIGQGFRNQNHARHAHLIHRHFFIAANSPYVNAQVATRSFRATLRQAQASTNMNIVDGDPGPGGPIRVVIIEDLREVREGLAMLINGTSGFQCASAYRTMEDALKGIEASRPDVILTDIGLPGWTGSKARAFFTSAFPGFPFWR